MKSARLTGSTNIEEESMTRVLASLFAFAFVGVAAYAHGGHDHIRGTVTQINGQSIVVQTTAKKTKTVTLIANTKFEKRGKPALLSDLKVGDRVVVDVPEGKLTAEEIQIGVATTAAKAAPAERAHK
jgi:ribosomal protein S1